MDPSDHCPLHTSRNREESSGSEQYDLIPIQNRKATSPTVLVIDFQGTLMSIYLDFLIEICSSFNSAFETCVQQDLKIGEDSASKHHSLKKY